MGERLKQLRKALGLTQEEFASRIGVKRGAIANYEIGRNVPVDAVYTLICKEFDVNPEWLRTGEGEMFAPRSIDALDALARERGLTHRDYIVIEKFLNLKPEVRAGLVDYFMEVSAALNGEAVEPDSPASTGAAIVEAEALYEKTLGFVPNTDSTASSTTDATGSTEKNKIG